MCPPHPRPPTPLTPFYPTLPPPLEVGDTFVLNCLGEGQYSALMKHFLQRFPPGADRFAGVPGGLAAAPGCGAPVLNGAIAYMQCTVRPRVWCPGLGCMLRV